MAIHLSLIIQPPLQYEKYATLGSIMYNKHDAPAVNKTENVSLYNLADA